MIYIGIDPGLTGAIAVLKDDKCLGVWDLPVMAKGRGAARVKNKINASALSALIMSLKKDHGSINAYIEYVSSMPGQGVGSVFSLGHTLGVIEGVVLGHQIPTVFITPTQWKNYYGVGSDKELARAKAIELYPQEQLSRKKDHNRAEALLIARFGMKIIGEA